MTGLLKVTKEYSVVQLLTGKWTRRDGSVFSLKGFSIWWLIMIWATRTGALAWMKRADVEEEDGRIRMSCWCLLRFSTAVVSSLYVIVTSVSSSVA